VDPLGETGVTAVSREEQLETESQLASRLLRAGDEERAQLYGAVYDEIWRMHLPTLGMSAVTQTMGANPRLLPALERRAREGDRALELGCGTGYMALELAKRGRLMTAIDASRVVVETARGNALQENVDVTFVAVEGVNLPFSAESFELAFSIELVEHLHERDVPRHLAEVFRVLKPGGAYCFWTPNRLMEVGLAERFGVATAAAGAGDVHLKEWLYGELAPLLRSAGFSPLRSPWRDTRLHGLPLLPVRSKTELERLTRRLPLRLRRIVAAAAGLVSCTLVAWKPRYLDR